MKVLKKKWTMRVNAPVLIVFASIMGVFLSCQTTGSSKNEQIVRRFMLEHFKNPTIIYEMCTDDFIVHWAWGESTYPASELVRMLSPPTDPHLEIDDCFASGDKVGMRFRVLFDHPSGNQVVRYELLIFRMEGDRIAEAWAYWDRRYEQKQRDEFDAMATVR